MGFEEWLAECCLIISATLQMDSATVIKMIDGSGEAVYRAKFGRRLSPQQCVDDELIYWNE